MWEELARVVFMGLVGWGLFISIRKALRLTGVVPYPPFKSRAEYLEAALEMNLEEFMERARVTPREVIQKLPAPKFRMATPEEAHSVGGMMPRPDPVAAQPDAKVGKWFRTKQKGWLARYRGPSDRSGWSVYEVPNDCQIKDIDCEPAYPIKGEWWQKLPCPKEHGSYPSVSWRFEPIQWNYSTNLSHESEGPEISAALCGCLVPYNFGKGNDGCGGTGSSGAGGAGEAFNATLDNMINKFSRGLEEVIALKKIEAMDPPLWIPRKWYRVKDTGALASLCDCSDKCGTFKVSDGQWCQPTQVEPAIPRAGEWWQQNASHPHAHFYARTNQPICWTKSLERWSDPETLRKAVEEGCLFPVNYGKGLQNQA